LYRRNQFTVQYILFVFTNFRGFRKNRKPRKCSATQMEYTTRDVLVSIKTTKLKVNEISFLKFYEY